MKTPTPLATAEPLSARIIDTLQPLCTRIAIAGSIRRKMPSVNDIDIVAIPRDFAQLRARILQDKTVVMDGLSNIIVRLKNHFEINVFIAHAGLADMFAPTPSNWGSILLCRTGSKEHNIMLSNRAARMGLHWEISRGITRAGELIASATEEDIFRALEMDFVAPENRR